MKVAIVHYWLVTMRGGEKVLEELCKLFPEADIYTNVYVPEKISDGNRGGTGSVQYSVRKQCKVFLCQPVDWKEGEDDVCQGLPHGG